jgi:hypothetical protein
MTLSAVVKCNCKRLINISQDIKPTVCKKCHTKIKHDNLGFYFSDDVPIQTVFKYPPSNLKYFVSEYPQIGKKIMIVMDDKEVILKRKWTKNLQDEYEKHHRDYSFTMLNRMLMWLELKEK